MVRNNHPSISNGMIKTELFRDPDNLKSLKVYEGGGYVGGPGGGSNQTHFMTEFAKKYSFTDITDITDGHTIFYRYSGIAKR